MKRFRHYAGLWGILTSSFIIFTAASSFDSISIGRHELKSSGLSQAIFGKAQTEDVQSAPVFENDTVSIIQSCNPEPVPVDTAAQTILIIGDSMLEGLVPRLAAYSDHNGHKLYAAMWYSSTSAVWGRSRKLQRYIERLHPTSWCQRTVRDRHTPQTRALRPQHTRPDRRNTLPVDRTSELESGHRHQLPSARRYRRRMLLSQRRNAIPTCKGRRTSHPRIGCRMGRQHNALDAEVRSTSDTDAHAHRSKRTSCKTMGTSA